MLRFPPRVVGYRTPAENPDPLRTCRSINARARANPDRARGDGARGARTVDTVNRADGYQAYRGAVRRRRTSTCASELELTGLIGGGIGFPPNPQEVVYL